MHTAVSGYRCTANEYQGLFNGLLKKGLAAEALELGREWIAIDSMVNKMYPFEMVLDTIPIMDRFSSLGKAREAYRQSLFDVIKPKYTELVE